MYTLSSSILRVRMKNLSRVSSNPQSCLPASLTPAEQDVERVRARMTRNTSYFFKLLVLQQKLPLYPYMGKNLRPWNNIENPKGVIFGGWSFCFFFFPSTKYNPTIHLWKDKLNFSGLFVFPWCDFSAERVGIEFL